MVDGSWPIAKQQKTKEEEQWYSFFGDKHRHVVLRGNKAPWEGCHIAKRTIWKKKRDLEDNLLPLIDLEDDLPSLINFAHVGELLEEVVRDQNSPNYHLVLEEALTNEDTTNYCLLSEEVTTHQNGLLPEEVVAHQETLNCCLL